MPKTPLDRRFHFWVAVREAEDLPGSWVAHCLDVDVVSAGTSPKHALAMVLEAVGLVVIDDLVHGREPTQRTAPAADWSEFHRIMQTAKPVAPKRIGKVPSGMVLLADLDLVTFPIAATSRAASTDRRDGVRRASPKARKPKGKVEFAFVASAA